MQVERVWQLIIGYHRPASPWSNWSSVRSKLGFVMPNSAEKIEKQVASHIVSVCWRSCNAIWLLSACCLLSGLADAQSTSDLSARAVQTMQAGDYGEAESLFARLTVTAPDVPELYSNLGLARYYQQKRGLARQAFAKAISLNSRLFVPNLYLAKIDCEEGKYAEALPSLRRAVKLQPEERASRILLAEVLSRTGAAREAITQYQELLKQHLQDTESLYRLTRLYLGQAQHFAVSLKQSDPTFTALLQAESQAGLQSSGSLATDAWQKALSDTPRVPGLRLPFAEFLLAKNRPSEAEAVLQEELQIDPLSYNALFESAEASLLRGDLLGTIDVLDKAARIRPEFFKPLPRLNVPLEHAEEQYAALEAGKEDGDFGRSFLKTELARKLNLSADEERWRAAAETTRDQLEHGVTSQMQAKVVPKAATARRALGLRYLRQKRLDEGLPLLMPMTKARLADPEVQYALAYALFEANRFGEAAAVLGEVQVRKPENLYLLISSYKRLATSAMETLAKIDPQSVELHKLIAESFADRHMFKEAEEEYDSAAKVQPDDPELYFGLGEAYFDQMQFQPAEQAYTHAIELRPSEAVYYVMRANALLELRRPEEAMAVARRALELNPNLLPAHVSIGRSLALLGQNEEAVSEMRKAEATDTDGMLHYNLFKLYRQLGRTAEANRALRISNELRSRQTSAGQPPAAPLQTDNSK